MRLTEKGAYDRDYYAERRALLSERSRKRYLANREEILQKCRERHARNRDVENLKNKRNHYKRNFGITLEQRAEMLAGGCQICAGAATHIDHSHSTGKVRGALCNNCNTGVGMFNDDVSRLWNAAKYLVVKGA